MRLLPIGAVHPPAFGSDVRTSSAVFAVCFVELDDEYLTSSRLQHKLEWVNGAEYKTDRLSKCYACKGKYAQDASRAFTFLAAYAHNKLLTVSQEDLKALSVGFVRQLPVVSDDRGVRQVAEEHGIKCWLTLDLLKVMVDCGHINLTKVNETLEYWRHENDLPRGLQELRDYYCRLFGGECPI